jgi:hypothetical protein
VKVTGGSLRPPSPQRSELRNGSVDIPFAEGTLFTQELGAGHESFLNRARRVNAMSASGASCTYRRVRNTHRVRRGKPVCKRNPRHEMSNSLCCPAERSRCPLNVVGWWCQPSGDFAFVHTARCSAGSRLHSNSEQAASTDVPIKSTNSDDCSVRVRGRKSYRVEESCRPMDGTPSAYGAAR